MSFTKQKIVEFKANRRYFLTWRKNLKPHNIRKLFYKNDEEEKFTIKDILPDENLEYCECFIHNIVTGDYQQGIKYVDEKGTYYLFWAAKTIWISPRSIAVGKAVDGKIYFIRESFPDGITSLSLIEIPEKDINKKVIDSAPKRYHNTIYEIPSHSKCITEEDIKCLNIAYEGAKAFSKLISKCLNK